MERIPDHVENSVAAETAVLYSPSGERPAASRAGSLPGTPASAGHQPCGGTRCVMAIAERHQVAQTDSVARCADRRNRRGRQEVDATAALESEHSILQALRKLLRLCSEEV